jgi:uncharacterized protein with von Willebrand factor type A (vWA) domain
MQSSIIHGIAGFTAYLRDHGFGVGIAEQRDMLAAVLQLPVQQYRQIQPCWRAIVCSNKDHWRRYPELFDLYWFPERARGRSRMSGTTRRSRSLAEMVQDMHAQMDSAGAKPSDRPLLGFADATASAGDDAARNDQAAGGASAVDPLAKRDFGEWLQSDLQQLNLLAEEVGKRIRKRLLRRKQISLQANSINMRGTFRKSIRFGGIPITPVWQRPRHEPPNIFILVDVSRSMETYAQLFLRVARAFCEVMQARAFVFHTRLAEITDLLKKRSGRVQEKINAVTFGFGGGTRIATSMRDFATVHAKSALATKSIVLVLSDGYDTDPAEELAQALQLIVAKGAKIFWLHPSERTHFSGALERASPYVKQFMPAHNLESLQKLPDLIY